MPETVFVTCLSPDVTEVVNQAVAILNTSQKLFNFRIAPREIHLSAPDCPPAYSWNLLGSVLAKEKKKLSARYLVGVLSEPIEHNWFSRTLHDERI